jgi:hypothetical protein
VNVKIEQREQNRKHRGYKKCLLLARRRDSTAVTIKTAGFRGNFHSGAALSKYWNEPSSMSSKPMAATCTAGE